MHRVAALAASSVLAAPAVFGAPCAGFTDVDASSSFCVNVAWMKNRGITLGTSATTYDPSSYVTRLQMAAFMYRLGYQNAFLQGGNEFGTTATVGTTDDQAVQIMAGGQVVALFDPSRLNPNIILGTAHPPVPLLPGTSGVTISGGHVNTATNGWATIGGGNGNRAGRAAMVPGGFGNFADGVLSFAAGHNANAAHDHCFVWGASTNHTSCFGPREVVMSGLGGFYFWTSGDSDATYSGARLAPGTGAWAAYSDRDGKHAIAPVDSRAILEKLVTMPIATWQWTAEPGSVRHMGPMAQDFRSTFELGDSNKAIVTVDADGVALAAIQGLNAKLEAEVASLRAELAAIRALVATPAAK